MKYNYKPKTELEKFGVKVYSALVENFPQTFFVGGTVRNLLLKKNVTDIDIATSARPQQVASQLKKYFIESNVSYQNLGVILATQGRLTAAVATLRKDLPSKNRYPKITFVKNYKTDSKRRDFTINSLYLTPKRNLILDPQGGLKDLLAKKIKIIRTAEKRIKQDPLRIIRALRFALVLNFKIENLSYLAIKKNFSLIGSLTKSKTQKEINKIKNRNMKKVLKKVINNPKLLDKYFK